jgi:hypothetical protein
MFLLKRKSKFINMKTTSFIVLLILANFITVTLYAQNYRVLQPGRTTQYMDSWGYLLPMQVDSVSISGTDTNYFLLKNLQQMDWECYHVQGPSWMGERVTIRPDGETSFYNIYDRPVTIKTKATLNEEWICYTETGLSFRASVSSVGVEDVLGITDSVKTISFQALNSEGQNTDHVVNNMNLILSKNYGLVKTLNFFDFPDFSFGIMVHGIDELILKGYNNPETGIQNLTWKQVHDHNIGDELHTISIQSWPDHEKYTENIATLLDKEIIGDTIANTWENKTKISIIYYTGEPSTFSAHIDTITVKITNDPDFDNLAGIAWQWWVNSYTINFMQAGEHGPTKTYGSLNKFFRGSEIYLGDTCYTDGGWDLRCYSEDVCYKGLGGPYYDNHCPHEADIRDLVYYKKDGVEWGTPLDFTVNTTLKPYEAKPEIVSVFPNPANDLVNILFKNNTGEYSLQITDNSGREIAAYSLAGEANTLDLSTLKPGIYYIRLITDNQTFIKKLIKH